MKKMVIPHPFPYQGSKRKIAEPILSFFPRDEKVRLIEPFAGSAAVSIAAAHKNKVKEIIINDFNKPLISLWNMILNDTETLSKEYEVLWNKQKGAEKKFYDEVRVKFNRTHKPEYLLFLMARCVKGSIRYNSKGEFNQGPDNRRKGMHPDKMYSNLISVRELLKQKTKIKSDDYRNFLKIVHPSDVVYMDPPYQGVCTNRDSRYIEGIKFEEFVEFLDALNQKNISFILSYDGRRGGKQYGTRLPLKLNLKHVEINAGKSTQATLLGNNEITYESLYISKALQKRLNGSLV